MERHYKYEVALSDVTGRPIITEGVVYGDVATTLYELVISDSFDKLTHGKAIYGQPGVGCKGPYRVRRILIEEVES